MSFLNYYFSEHEFDPNNDKYITNTYKVYCDMDGVLTDFEESWKSLNVSDKTFREYEDEKGSPYAFAVLKRAGGIKFWSDMPWKKDGKELWNYIKKYHPTLLTTPAQFDESKEGKEIWIKRELGEDIPFIFSKTKGEYAKPNRILIDDYQKKIDNWVENGGIGILHKSTEKTIKELKKLGL